MKNDQRHIKPGSFSFKMIMLLIYIPVLISVLFSCTERIDITTDEEFQKLAVESYITPDSQVVKLTETSGYFSQLAPAPVSNALVLVNDGENNYQFIEKPERPGYYIPSEGMDVGANKTYSIAIELQEMIGGKSLYESTEPMPNLNFDVDSIRMVWDSDFETWIMEMYTWEPAGPNWYMFNASVNGKPVTDSLSRIGITDDRIVDGIYLNGVYVLFLNEDEVNVGDTVVCSTSAISEDYYRYLTEAQTELFPKVPLFSGPPANVRSNISNGAVGYFAVFSSDLTTTIVRSKEE